MAASFARIFVISCAVLLAGCESLIQEALQPEPLKAGNDWEHARQVGNSPSTIDRVTAVAQLTSRVKQNPEENLEPLVQALVANRTDPFERVRAIHDWITRNIAYDFAAYQGISPKIIEPYAVIRHGASICDGYAHLFTLMCTLAGIQSQVVVGYGRGYGFDPFAEDKEPYQSNHAWNAVLVEDAWYLVDATWDAGGIEGQTNTFKWQYSTGFLFTPPEIFLCTHFPDDPRWQLLDQPLDLAHFRAQPVLWGDFGTLGLERKSAFQRVANVGGEGEILIRVPPHLQISGYLSADGLSPETSMSLVARKQEGDLVSLKTLFPKPGRYGLALNVSRDGDESKPVFLGELFFVSTGGSLMRSAFVYPGARQAGVTLDEESGYLYQVGGTTSFSYTCSQETAVILSNSSHNDFPNRVRIESEGTRRRATISFPAPGDYTVTLVAQSKTDPTQWIGVGSLTYVAREAGTFEYPEITAAGKKRGVALKDALGYVPTAAGETQFSLSVHAPILVSLLDGANKGVEGHAFAVGDGDEKTVHVSFPRPGSYTVLISALAPGQGKDWENVASLHFQATAAGRVFPLVSPAADQAGFQLVAPMDGVLKAGQDVPFQVKGPAAGIVYVQNGAGNTELHEVAGVYSGVVRVTAGSLMVIGGPKRAGSYTGIATYQVR